MAKSCKCKPTECEECPEWIFTFADLVMLMMGFFVILWVLKPTGDPPNGNAKKEWLDAVIEIRKAFDYLPDPNSKDPIDIEMILRKIQALKTPLKGPGDGGETKRPRQGAEGTDPKVTDIRAGDEEVRGGKILFDPGSAQLSPEARRQIEQIVPQIKGHRIIVLVKGNTALDDFTGPVTPQQQMRLSVDRAQAVADALTANGVEADILRVQGCSTFEPVAQRAYDSAARDVNRRVEIEATGNLVKDRQDQTTKNSAEPSPALPHGPATEPDATP